MNPYHPYPYPGLLSQGEQFNPQTPMHIQYLSPIHMGYQQAMQPQYPIFQQPIQSAHPNSLLFQTPLPSSTARKRRRQVSSACVNCALGHLSCSETRPCVRCLRKGLDCVSRPRKKPRPSSPSGSTEGSAPEQVPTQASAPKRTKPRAINKEKVSSFVEGETSSPTSQFPSSESKLNSRTEAETSSTLSTQTTVSPVGSQPFLTMQQSITMLGSMVSPNPSPTCTTSPMVLFPTMYPGYPVVSDSSQVDSFVPQAQNGGSYIGFSNQTTSPVPPLRSHSSSQQSPPGLRQFLAPIFAPPSTPQ